MLIYTIAWTSYLLVAQQDSPQHILYKPLYLTSYIPFLPWTPKRCFQVTLSVWRYIRACVGFLRFGIDWYFQYKHLCEIQRNGSPALYVIDTDISESVVYSLPFSHKQLDVYPPATEPQTNVREKSNGMYSGSPVVVFVPAALIPVQLTSNRKAYIQLATNMQQLGYCVVVPEITYYPKDRIRQSVVDLRLTLSWVGAHITTYGGDPSRLYLLGSGLSAELITLTLVQEAVVLSRTVNDPRAMDKHINRLPKDMEISLNKTELYAPQIRVPAVSGVILIAGLCDVIKGFRHECELGVEDLSILRRWTGPQSAQCLVHSPTHLLDYFKSMIDPSFLPSRFLLIHGGRDGYIPISHSILLKSLLEEIGVESVELRAFREMTHADTLKCLLACSSRQASYAVPVMTAIYRFIL